MSKKAIIIGAGPAGLTAAFELLQRTDIIPVILEKSGDIGGISKTVNYKGNRMDIGGHRFFSKSDRVMQWWLDRMPLDPTAGEIINIKYQNKSRQVAAATSTLSDPDKIMLVRNRLSRIYFLRKFFAYPIQLSIDTIKKLGPGRTLGILFSYAKARLFPRKPEKNLEDFFINRFGEKLYRLFFKGYTEKVWGVACTDISAEWGAQRIKGISISRALAHAVRSLKPRPAAAKGDLSQKETETSLIERFLYPKFGPGQLWEEVARQVREKGGQIHMNQDVKAIHTTDRCVTAIEANDSTTGEMVRYAGDYFFSTMPVKELIGGMDGTVPAEIKAVAEGLPYRDFITVGVLLSKLTTDRMLPDTWIYIQENDVKVGRLQIFNNWSPFMVKDPDTVWLGMEYFCNMTDEFWQLSNTDIQAIAIGELQRMGLASVEDVLDSTVLRVEKTYPAYFGTYDRFDEIRQFTDGFANLFLVGRNGMHKYNNSDHSMLTAMVAVDNISAGVTAKTNIWAINTEQEYHEEKVYQEKPPRPVNSQGGPRPLWSAIWQNRVYRTRFVLGLLVLIIQFCLFKVRYPYANYMPDSYSYLQAAADNYDVNIWPVAYSKFLRQVSVYSHSDKVVVTFQYFFMQVAAFLFLLTLFRILRPGKAVRTILVLFFLFDPAILYVSNYISADSLFIGFSFLWLTSLLYIIYESRPWQLPVQAILLLVCFTIRYNAIYYPFIAALAFVISKQGWLRKLTGIGLSAALVYLSIFITSNKMKEVTGHRQFSAFGGWQMASNALFMYQNVNPKDRKPLPARFSNLETAVRRHMDTLSKVKFTKNDTVGGRFYLWNAKSPLIQYVAQEWKKDSTTPSFTRWASAGPLYLDYGACLIRHYPCTFFSSVVLPNAVRYAIPPAEFLEGYNMGADSVAPLAKAWFNYKSQKVDNHHNSQTRIGVMSWYPVFAALGNALFVISLIGLLLFNGLSRRNRVLFNTVLFLLAAWLFNAGFSILASPIVLRYQLFPLITSMTAAVIFCNTIYTLAVAQDLHNKTMLQ